MCLPQWMSMYLYEVSIELRRRNSLKVSYLKDRRVAVCHHLKLGKSNTGEGEPCRFLFSPKSLCFSDCRLFDGNPTALRGTKGASRSIS